MTRKLAAAFAAMGMATLVGCRPAPPPPAPPTVTSQDSSGIHIVQSSAPSWPGGHGWSVDSATVDIGAPDGAFRGFHHPSAVIRLSDGRIVVADGGYDQLFVFSSTGHFLYAAGSVGTAAGQFQALWGVFRGPSDTLVAFDAATSRVTRFDPNGALVDTATLSVPAGSNGFVPQGITSTGEMVLLRDETPIPFPGPAWSVAANPGVLIHFSHRGIPLDSITGFNAGELFGLPAPQAGGGTVVIPAGRPLGRTAAIVVSGDTTWVGTGASYSITAYVAGRPVRIIRIARPLAVVPESLVTEFKRRRRVTGAARGDVIDSIFVASLDSVSFPDYLPAYGRALVDPSGDLWLQDAGLPELAPGDASLSWTVFDPTGAWLGAVTLAPGFAPQEIGKDYALGFWAPAGGGAMHVRLYPLRRSVANAGGK